MRVHAAALVALWLLALVVRFDATAARVSAGHGDVAAYHQVARNLHAGRGFEQDFVADRLAGPTALPTPSNTWWRPLPSIVGWLGMTAAGEASYVAGKRAMLLLSACVPWVAYLAGWLLLRRRAAALAAGLLAVGFHLYLDQPNQLLSHGPYALFGGAALVLALGVERWTRHLPWFGLCLGLAYLSRGDAQVLPLVLAAALVAARCLGERRAIPWRALAGAAGLFALTVAPWWARNLSVFGAPMPPGVSKVAFAATYEDWFSDPEQLTWDDYKAELGWDGIARQKRAAVADAVAFVPLCMSAAVDRGRAVEPGAPTRRIHLLGRWVLGPLLWIGFGWLLVARTRSALLVLLQIALLVGVYGVVFTAVGRNSFHSSLFSVYPVFLVCIVSALELALRPLVRGRERLRDAATLALAGLLAALNLWAARPHLAAKYAGVEELLAPYRALGAWVESQALERPVFYCRNPWQLSTEARVGAVMIPAGDADEIRSVAATFGVTHLMDETAGPDDLLKLRPGLAPLLEGGELVPVPAPTPLRLYRLEPRGP
jgi:hypothetical protein